jgi:hypothetical protein
MNYEDVLLDFVRRTRENLELTEQWRLEHRDARFNEVTHLINSLLGFIVLPKERVLERLRQVEVTRAGVPKWGVRFELIEKGGRLPADLRPFLKGLRNSVAHASFEFASDGTNLSGVTFAHQTRDQPPKMLWQAAFDLGQLRSFLTHLTYEVEEACTSRARTARPRIG